jgi:hypothetical protein
MNAQDLLQFIKRNPVGISCLVLALGLGGWIYYRSDAGPALEEELRRRQGDAQRLENNVKYSAQLKEQLASLQASAKEIDSRIVRAGQVGANTQFFYQLESETAVKLKDLRPAAVVPPAKGAKSPFVPVGFMVSADGSYVQLLEFLRRIESGPRYARIVSASLSGSLADRRVPLTLSLSVELLGLP